MTAVVDSGLFESTMSLPLHNHFRLYIGGDLLVYHRHYCWPVSFRNDCLRDRCYCGRTGWLQQSYPERLTPLFLSYVKSFGLAFEPCPPPLGWLFAFETHVKRNTSTHSRDACLNLDEFETYVKSLTSKTTSVVVMSTNLFETYAKSSTFKICINKENSKW